MCKNNDMCYDFKMIYSDSLQLIMMDFYICVCQSKAQSESLTQPLRKGLSRYSDVLVFFFLTVFKLSSLF